MDTQSGRDKSSSRVMEEWVWRIVPIIFAVAAAWVTMKMTVQSLERDKLDTWRFLADSIDNAHTLDDISRGVREANGRLREIQCGLPAVAGCR